MRTNVCAKDLQPSEASYPGVPASARLAGWLDREQATTSIDPVGHFVGLHSSLCLTCYLRLLPDDEQGYRKFKPSSRGMDEPVSSWTCFDSFDWLALHLFLTLRLKNPFDSIFG